MNPGSLVFVYFLSTLKQRLRPLGYCSPLQNKKEWGFIFLPQRKFFPVLASASNISGLASNLWRCNGKRQRRRRRRRQRRRRGRKDQIDVCRREVRRPLHRHRLSTLTMVTDDIDVDVLPTLPTSPSGLSLFASLHLSIINLKKNENFVPFQLFSAWQETSEQFIHQNLKSAFIGNNMGWLEHLL